MHLDLNNFYYFRHVSMEGLVTQTRCSMNPYSFLGRACFFGVAIVSLPVMHVGPECPRSVGLSLSFDSIADQAPYNSSISSSPKSRAGKSPASHRSGRTKTPQLLPHSKYRFPLTDPSFLPVGSSSVTPIQTPMPGISGTAPIYDAVPLRASDSGRRRTRHDSVKPVCSCQ